MSLSTESGSLKALKKNLVLGDSLPCSASLRLPHLVHSPLEFKYYLDRRVDPDWPRRDSSRILLNNFWLKFNNFRHNLKNQAYTRMLNYILIIIYKMASLQALMNRAVTYFKESTSGTNSGTSGTNSGNNSEVSTDNESNSVGCVSSVDGMSTDDNEIIPCEDAPMYLCIMCEYTVPTEEYNTECQRCNYCILLTEEGEKQCVECKELKHFKLYEYLSDDRCKQCVTAWRKIKKYFESCNCTVHWGSLSGHLKSKKNRMNSYVEQPITSTKEYIKCGVCNSFMHRSSFIGTDRCNLCKIDRNSPKKHCEEEEGEEEIYLQKTKIL
jgi:hypothetical protein